MKRETNHILLKNNIGEIARLTAFIEELGSRYRLSTDEVAKLTLAMEEMVANVIMYAYPAESEQPIEVTAEVDADKIVFTIEDDGLEFDPTIVEDADIRASAEERPIGGLGIFIARNIMDTISYQRLPNKNRLTLTKSRQ